MPDTPFDIARYACTWWPLTTTGSNPLLAFPQTWEDGAEGRMPFSRKQAKTFYPGLHALWMPLRSTVCQLTWLVQLAPLIRLKEFGRHSCYVVLFTVCPSMYYTPVEVHHAVSECYLSNALNPGIEILWQCSYVILTLYDCLHFISDFWLIIRNNKCSEK